MRHVLAGGLAVVLLGLAAPAVAHITAHPDAGVAGAYFETKFVVPHGCDGSATSAVRVKIPPGVTAVKPQMKAGWEVTIKTRKLDKPITNERGAQVFEVVDEVDWHGGPLPNTLYDEFGLVMKLPADADRTLYFPTVQECSQGVNRWIEIPTAGQAWGALRAPAPFVRLLPKSP